MLAKLLGHGAKLLNVPRRASSSISCVQPCYVTPGLIDFVAAGLPEYKDCYAIVIDSLFSKPELSAILAEAEASSPWEVAKINAGTQAYTNTSYRNGHRIIYDSSELSEEIFKKVRPHLSDIEEIEETAYIDCQKAIQKWKMVRLNERLRLLRYSEGGFFRKHVDGCYINECAGRTSRGPSIHCNFTSPLIPPDRMRAFFRPKEGRRDFWVGRRTHADVQATPGRVLVFQHAPLLHTGEEVTGGVKCAVRSDILYEKVGKPIPVAKK